MKEDRIYIVGYMASGKTTFGKALAEKIGWDFVDLDNAITESEGKTIPEIMKNEGEAGFREIESRLLRQTASSRQTVIACGGGTPCYRDNMEFMTLHGITLWLIATPERMAERIIRAGDTRPLASGKGEEELLMFVRSHLLSRQPHYCKAMLRHSGENLENAEEISRSVDEFLSGNGGKLNLMPN